MQALFYSQGFLMPLIRMAEPGSLKMHLKLLWRLVSCRHIKDEDNDDVKISPIRILFNSTLNIEFVYVILEGIVNFSKMSFAD